MVKAVTEPQELEIPLHRDEEAHWAGWDMMDLDMGMDTETSSLVEKDIQLGRAVVETMLVEVGCMIVVNMLLVELDQMLVDQAVEIMIVHTL